MNHCLSKEGVLDFGPSFQIVEPRSRLWTLVSDGVHPSYIRHLQTTAHEESVKKELHSKIIHGPLRVVCLCFQAPSCREGIRFSVSFQRVSYARSI